MLRGYFCLRATRATVLLLKGTEKITEGSALTIFVPHAEEAILNSHHIQHFSVSCLISYEVFLLTVLHIILLHCNNLSPDTLLLSVTSEVSHGCLVLMDHFLTPHDGL